MTACRKKTINYLYKKLKTTVNHTLKNLYFELLLAVLLYVIHRLKLSKTSPILQYSVLFYFSEELAVNTPLSSNQITRDVVVTHHVVTLLIPYTCSDFVDPSPHLT